jgi:hypothetical protein
MAFAFYGHAPFDIDVCTWMDCYLDCIDPKTTGLAMEDSSWVFSDEILLSLG